MILLWATAAVAEPSYELASRISYADFNSFLAEVVLPDFETEMKVAEWNSSKVDASPPTTLQANDGAAGQLITPVALSIEFSAKKKNIDGPVILFRCPAELRIAKAPNYGRLDETMTFTLERPGSRCELIVDGRHVTAEQVAAQSRLDPQAFQSRLARRFPFLQPPGPIALQPTNSPF